MIILYDNVFLHDGWATLVPNPADGSVYVNDGYGVANVLDGRRETQWKVNDNWGLEYVTIEFIPGSTITDEPFLTFNGIGLCGINAKEIQLKQVIVSIWTGSAWGAVGNWNNIYTNLLSSLPDGTYIDLMMEMTTPATIDDKVRVLMYFTSSLATLGVSAKIGEIILGTVTDLGTEANVPLNVSFRQPFTRVVSAGGGHWTVGKPGVSESWEMTFRNVTGSTRDIFKTIVQSSKGGVRPMLASTHRHTGSFAWVDQWTSGQYQAGLGPAYFFNFDNDYLPESEIGDDVYDIDFPLHRSLSEDEIE